jgi:hypothetical protein
MSGATVRARIQVEAALAHRGDTCPVPRRRSELGDVFRLMPMNDGSHGFGQIVAPWGSSDANAAPESSSIS